MKIRSSLDIHQQMKTFPIQKFDNYFCKDQSLLQTTLLQNKLLHSCADGFDSLNELLSEVQKKNESLQE